MATDDDDEATRRINPAERAAKPAAADDDDDATKATGTPKKALEAQRVLEESRRLNAAGGPKEPKKKLHPLVPLGVAFAILAAVLLLLNWFTRPLPGDSTERPGVRKLFDW